ncbi:putative spermidine/putrescine transport system substrate-binding protein [Thermomonospora echinospora]|uniref:Putative spermidine/putrescine transport system substrate-binding protein n=1 Tax=Thermomonospora echinospora TaxID=1992 RepID=A0A1H5SNB0_9ACTN|nr:ABC transporter substrate-binding protein [Thermomonospora echinospora]SEF52015.1 putative spermidine/putrescine transport system substrate-binding protein [Thermomonospora echinospora]
MNKSHVLRLAAAAAAVTMAAACGGGSGSGADVDLGTGPAKAGSVKKDALKGVNLTFVSYGGVYQSGQEKAAVEPFAAESGARVLSDGPTDYAKIKAQVDSGNVTWDVVDTDAIWGESQCGKLLAPLDYSIIDKSNVPEGLAGECTVPAMQYGMVLAYNKDKYGANPPQGWADFFDTAKFPGKRAIPGIANDAAPGPYEAALVADGVAPDQLFPLDVERANKKLTSIRPNLVFWKTGAESQQLLESGEADMVMLWSGRAYDAIKNGAKYEVQWNQFMPIMDVLAVPKGARNPKAAMALINYYLGAQQQAKLTELTSYSPIHTGAQPTLDPLGTAFLTTSPERSKQALKIDAKWWAANQHALIEKWSAWLGG